MATPLQSIDHNMGNGQLHFANLGESQAVELTLGLSRALQTSLDPVHLVDLFSDELQAAIPHDGMVYSHPAINVSHKIGSQARNRCSYNLHIGDEPLGELVFCRRKKFSDLEMTQMENYLCYLLYPLRNALLYQHAINMAQKDPLTGIDNRAALDDALEREISFARRKQGDLALVVLDIDHFKSINDRYGHVIGDCVLKAVVDTVQGCMRGTDQVFRYGGEEFVVLMRATDADGACLLAERIRAAVEAQACHCSGAEIPVTISAGVSNLREHDTPVTLFSHADQALYLAKDRGRNQVRCAGTAN